MIEGFQQLASHLDLRRAREEEQEIVGTFSAGTGCVPVRVFVGEVGELEIEGSPVSQVVFRPGSEALKVDAASGGARERGLDKIVRRAKPARIRVEAIAFAAEATETTAATAPAPAREGEDDVLELYSETSQDIELVDFLFAINDVTEL